MTVVERRTILAALDQLEQSRLLIEKWMLENSIHCKAMALLNMMPALELRKQLEIDPGQAKSDEYVAWLAWRGHADHRHLVLCDSDSPGAFQVYRSLSRSDISKCKTCGRERDDVEAIACSDPFHLKTWMLIFEDPDRAPEHYTSEKSARDRYAACKQSWSCHLFEKLD